MNSEKIAEFKPHYLPGRGRRGGSSTIGVVHAVLEVHGDNFSAAACGKKPSGKSLGWAETSREITCKACIASVLGVNQ